MPMTGIEHQERLMELELTSDRHPLNTSLMHIGYTSKSSLCWIRGKEVLLFVGWWLQVDLRVDMFLIYPASWNELL